MGDEGNTETGLVADCYNTVAFKGQGTQHLAEVILDVMSLGAGGKSLYPPSFATRHDPILEHGIVTEPQSKEGGKISLAEAVALKVMADEGSAVAQNLFRGMALTGKISKLLGDNGGWPSDVVEGIAHLGYALIAAVGIRQMILDGKQCPTGRTFGETMTRENWGRYHEALQNDKMTIGQETVTAAIDFTNTLVERLILGDGTDDPNELQNRSISVRKGIELGARIYLQVLEISIQRGLPSSLGEARIV